MASQESMVGQTSLTHQKTKKERRTRMRSTAEQRRTPLPLQRLNGTDTIDGWAEHLKDDMLQIMVNLPSATRTGTPLLYVRRAVLERLRRRLEQAGEEIEWGIARQPTIHLTPRLYDVLILMNEGKRAKDIARILHCQRTTIYGYMRDLHTLFDVGTYDEVVRKARMIGYL